MIGALLATVSVIFGQQATPAKPAVDRSGEAALRKVLTWAASLKKSHGMVVRSYRQSGDEIFYPDGLIEFWLQDAKFHVSYGDMWGSSAIVIGDGVKVLEDMGEDPVTVRKPAKTFVEQSSAFESKGSAATPFFYLLEGPALLDRLDKDREIKLAPPSGDLQEIVWDSSLFGKIYIRFQEKPKGLDVQVIEYDNMPWQKEMFETFPEWFDRPDERNRWRHSVIVGNLGRVRRGLFSTKPGRGREVNDQTKTAKNLPPKI